MAKKRLEWNDSDAPDAKGKFRELSPEKLAAWLIKTRRGNVQKINGSLMQQINFNKRNRMLEVYKDWKVCYNGDTSLENFFV